MLNRNISQKLHESLEDTPVILLNGPRQSGKSTLVKSLIASHNLEYITFDDMSAIAAAKNNPLAFARSFDGSIILDEVQHVEELFPAIKAVVDEDRSPGRFILTGSANIMMLPKISESLAGRMEILSLWPFSQGELLGIKENFVDRVFEEKNLRLQEKENQPNSLTTKIIRGGYPEIITRKREGRRFAWYRSYIETILKRDIRDVSDIQSLTDLPRLLQLMASRTSCLLNYAELSRCTGIPQTTLKRHITLLQAVFLIQMIPPWMTNLSKRVTKSPKLVLCDTGLLSYLLGVDEKRYIYDRVLFGKILENFVTMELIKQISWSKRQPAIFHFRTQAGQEVDLVLEDRSGFVVGIEVKASSILSRKDFSGLQILKEAAKDRFRLGIILYNGQKSYTIDDKIIAMPISTIWSNYINSE